MNDSRNRSGSRRLGLFLAALAVIVLVIIVVYAVHNRYLYRPPPEPEEVSDGLRLVVIIDGDTGVLSRGETVRYLGIDTPERGEPFYLDATQANMALCIDKVVRLERDGREFDSYGRTLAYVFVDDTIMVNERLVAAGLASVYIFPQDQKNMEYRERLVLAQSDARRARRGIWSLPPPEPVESLYLGNAKTLRFHRPGCRTLRRSDGSKLLRSECRDDFLDSGYAACRVCKP